MMHRRGGLTAAVALVSTLVLVACAGEADDPAETSPPATGSPSTPAATDEPTATPDPTPSPTEQPAPVDPADFPGEPTDFGPAAGDTLAVRGVEADDVLHVRAGPGVEFDVVAELSPTADDVSATGSNRQLDLGIWAELETDGTTGWSNLAYLGYLGQVRDITHELPVMPSGTDLVVLAEEVAQQRMHDARADIDVVVVDGPHEGDLGEVTVDVLGVMDDSVLGERLHVFAQPDGDRYTVRTVEATVLCARGITDDRLCL